MKRWLLGVIVLVVLAACLSLSSRRAEAEYPQYLFVQPSYGGYGQMGQPQTYAYGWFGVAPRQMWTCHWDYYDCRWIWR